MYIKAIWAAESGQYDVTAYIIRSIWILEDFLNCKKLSVYYQTMQHEENQKYDRTGIPYRTIKDFRDATERLEAIVVKKEQTKQHRLAIM